MSDSETKLSESTGGPGPQGVTAVQKGIAVGLLLLLGAGWLFLHNRPAPAPTEAPLEERALIPPNRPVESDVSPTEPSQENSTTTIQLNQGENQDSGVKVTERAEEPSDGMVFAQGFCGGSIGVARASPIGFVIDADRKAPRSGYHASNVLSPSNCSRVRSDTTRIPVAMVLVYETRFQHVWGYPPHQGNPIQNQHKPWYRKFARSWNNPLHKALEL